MKVTSSCAVKLDCENPAICGREVQQSGLRGNEYQHPAAPPSYRTLTALFGHHFQLVSIFPLKILHLPANLTQPGGRQRERARGEDRCPATRGFEWVVGVRVRTP